jgi:SAM-dependent methyltransferase
MAHTVNIETKAAVFAFTSYSTYCLLWDVKFARSGSTPSAAGTPRGQGQPDGRLKTAADVDIKEQAILGDSIGSHWYYRSKGAALRRILGPAPVRHVLDVGAGSGVFSRILLDHGAGEATCVDPGYPLEYVESHAGRTIRFVRAVEPGNFDLVLLMDVLEHVEDDVGLLRAYAELAPARARFLITVPAFQWMWSGHDVFLEHRRRYTLSQVEDIVSRAGLRRLRGCYYYGFTLPLAAARRLSGRLAGVSSDVAKSDLHVHSALVNEALGAVCAAELNLFLANRIAGLTVFCLAEKR